MKTTIGRDVKPNRSNPVTLLIDGIQHGETDHADLINEQDGLPLHTCGLIVGGIDQGGFPMVSDGMAQDLPHRPKLLGTGIMAP
jgi:hypothetical protein